ncbi:hypothetical protein Ga0123462_0936 [Mariprofundus ferrinatatus]|uniref:Uncharacterized protein n=2 Tax=Mariprofundus ferrinatatus TaxID=1921087 RepID=A0A2K8L397_9PROT|nr:hypothetical protein Ga0123462_0936 [Mariprofundus ferrinatatus]
MASETPVSIPSHDFHIMLAFARTVFALKDNQAYLEQLERYLPDAAKIRTTWPSVLMGFDFHLTPEGPKLIEINNNAGGLYIGEDCWFPQPDIVELKGSLEERLVGMFREEWMSIAIMDENVTEQFMYPEMLAYAELFERHGRHAVVVSPEDLQLTDNGLSVDGRAIDAIYNRHTDFYLEEADIRHIRQAYERGQVVINPHPRSYALIGDKSRMVDWWRPGLLEACVDDDSLALIRAVTPETIHLAETDSDKAWSERKDYVFKPAARHGGKGVVIGRGMSRKRFDSFDLNETIMQKLVPPSVVDVEGVEMKLDIRLFMHGRNLIALAGRVWRGQVTNFREPGSGWVALSIEG